jgi:AraC-like DNA-binding protein
MTYQSPAIQYQAPLSEVLRRLIPPTRHANQYGDFRIDQLMQYIDSQDGNLGCNVRRACSDLKLGISGAHAGRLFKRFTGFGIREYAETRRMSLAIELLKHTALPIKVIAAELGYHAAPHFTRRFKERFRSSPTQFRNAAR